MYPRADQGKELPRLTLVVVGKRHHTRFYASREGDADQWSNPRPGTVVGRGVTEARNWDFFLQSHVAIQGTARPAHYFVLLDEIFHARYAKTVYNDQLAHKEGERPENVPWYKPVPPLDRLPKRWEDLCKLRDELTTLSTHLVTAEQAFFPQLAEMEHMVCTGHMWAPKMVDVYSPVESRSPNGFIKIRDERGYEADLFVRANADFQNDVRLTNRIGSLIQVQWLPYRLPDGRYQVAPELHSVEMPKEAWHTVARVAAVLGPHPGRQSHIEDILDKPKWRSDGPWLEKEMEAFFQKEPGKDPARLLADGARRVRLLDGQMDPDPTSRKSTPPLRSFRSEPGSLGGLAPPALLLIEGTTGETTEEDAGAKAREWQEQQRMDIFSLEEVDKTFIVAGCPSGEGSGSGSSA